VEKQRKWGWTNDYRCGLGYLASTDNRSSNKGTIPVTRKQTAPPVAGKCCREGRAKYGRKGGAQVIRKGHIEMEGKGPLKSGPNEGCALSQGDRWKSKEWKTEIERKSKNSESGRRRKLTKKEAKRGKGTQNTLSLTKKKKNGGKREGGGGELTEVLKRGGSAHRPKKRTIKVRCTVHGRGTTLTNWNTHSERNWLPWRGKRGHTCTLQESTRKERRGLLTGGAFRDRLPKESDQKIGTSGGS